MTALNPLRTIGYHLTEVICRYRKVSKKEAETIAVKMLRQVGIPSPEARMKQYPHEFSGGMRQRVIISMALCCEPSLLIADEPTTALDVTIQAQILELLKQLKQELGLTYLFTAHDLSMVHHISDRIGVMYLGSMVELGTSEEVFENPQHPYTKALISAIPIADPELGRQTKRILIQGELPSPMNAPKGCRFCTRCPYATDRCREERPEFREVQPGHFARCHIL